VIAACGEGFEIEMDGLRLLGFPSLNMLSTCHDVLMMDMKFIPTSIVQRDDRGLVA
jgi:hypothetical protein